MQLLILSRSGNTDRLKLIVKREKIKRYICLYDSLNITDSMGWNALHYAVSKGHLDCVKILNHNIKSLALSKDRFGITPIDLAIVKGNPEIIKELQNNK